MGSGPFGRVCGELPRKRKYAKRMSREKRIRFIGDAIEAAWVAEVSANGC